MPEVEKHLIGDLNTSQHLGTWAGSGGNGWQWLSWAFRYTQPSDVEKSHSNLQMCPVYLRPCAACGLQVGLAQ